MQNHHRHYLIYVQLSLFVGLILLSFGAHGLNRMLTSLPFIVSAGLLYVTARLCLAIIKMLMPELNVRSNRHMHGSTMPITVIYPEM